MPPSTGKYFSCIYCGTEFIAVIQDDKHTKPNKNRINRDDIETLHKCNEGGKNK
jgi:hypothetical protein